METVFQTLRLNSATVISLPIAGLTFSMFQAAMPMLRHAIGMSAVAVAMSVIAMPMLAIVLRQNLKTLIQLLLPYENVACN